MRRAWLPFAALFTAAMLTASGLAMPAPAQRYYAKLSAGGTFVEEAKWDTTVPGFEHDTGIGKFTANVSEAHDIELLVDNGTVTVIDVGNKPRSAVVSTGFSAEGTHIQIRQPNANDHGTLNFSGATGTAAATVTDDFDPNGGNLSFNLSYQAVLSGVCKDDKFADNCGENTALPGVPEVSAGGNANPLKGKMGVNGGGGFISLTSSRPADPSGNSTNWKGLSCTGNIAHGWNCAYSGSKVWTKAPGVTYTQRVQFNAKIFIVSREK